MNLKEKCRMLGLGCYGGKQMKEFIALGYKGDAANGSEQDLKVLGDITKYHLNNFDGFGGNREKGATPGDGDKGIRVHHHDEAGQNARASGGHGERALQVSDRVGVLAFAGVHGRGLRGGGSGARTGRAL